MKVTVRFGVDSWTRNYPQGAKVQNILNDHDLKLVAGWGDNVRALVAGVPQSPETTLSEGMVVVVETMANDKAS